MNRAAHGAHVQCHILARVAIAARDAAHQLAVFIAQRQRHAIQLELTHILNVLAPAEFMHAPLPIPQLFFAVGVVERKHWHGMRNFDESLARLATNALRR